MPIADGTEETGDCSFCGLPAPLYGLFGMLGADYAGKVICFACLIIQTLRQTICSRCETNEAAAFVLIRGDDGRIGPMAVCPECFLKELPSAKRVFTNANTREVVATGTGGKSEH